MLNKMIILIIFCFLGLYASVSLADQGTASLKNATNCVCSGQNDSCNIDAAAGKTIYTFNLDQNEYRKLSSTIALNATGQAPIVTVPGTQYDGIIVGNDQSGFGATSIYVVNPGDSGYIISKQYAPQVVLYAFKKNNPCQ